MEIDISKQNELSLVRRLYIYQNERFPVVAHGLLISAFTFSAISYSRICRGGNGFVRLGDYVIGVLLTVSLFLLVRIFDEFKDKEEDAKYRSYLPVPRGLISFKELNILAVAIVVFQCALLLVYQPNMFWLYGIVMLYLLLMRVEFFIPSYLKKHQILYITSHMVIIPLIDIYASGIDWLIGGAHPHWGLAFFFAVSYLNGLVLEFGRKIRAPQFEEEGVISYTSLYGTRKGTWYYLVLMFLTLLGACAASYYVGFGVIAFVILGILFVLCAFPAFLFIRRPGKKLSKQIEYFSALWTISMYLTLGAVPMIKSLLS
ncbi:MAG: UbiA family prenyltransferase [Bacteroidales bacterium]|nr:UbiA family prenyltransferase [Bacteroidales bacterium]